MMHSPNYNKSKLLWVEDNADLVSALRDAFLQSYQVSHYQSLEAVQNLEEPAIRSFEVALIDMDLPNSRSGEQVLDALRTKGFSAPALVLSNDESHATRMRMLSLGVDDYLWKAMHPDEISLRMQNSIKRFKSKQQLHSHVLGNLKVDLNHLSVFVDEIEINLTKIEIKLLLVLFRNDQFTASIEQLSKEAWGLAHVEVGTINTFVWKMNRKLQNWHYRIQKSDEFISFVKK